jgi:hypothetical protein
LRASTINFKQRDEPDSFLVSITIFLAGSSPTLLGESFKREGNE